MLQYKLPNKGPGWNREPSNEVETEYSVKEEASKGSINREGHGRAQERREYGEQKLIQEPLKI